MDSAASKATARPPVLLSMEERQALASEPAARPAGQPSPYSDNGPAPLAPDEMEIRVKAEQARTIIEEVIGLRRATSIAPGQTPMLDILVNTLIVEYAALTGTLLVIEPERRATR